MSEAANPVPAKRHAEAIPGYRGAPAGPVKSGPTETRAAHRGYDL